MAIKALFFDIDGTLVSFRTHRIPDSAVQALTLARAHGVKIFISTGRPISIITNLGQIEHLIDGYITANGAYCIKGKEIICCHAMAHQDIMSIIKDADKQDYPVIIVGEREFVVYNNKPIVHRIFTVGLNVENIDYTRTLDDVFKERILQMTAFVDKKQEETLAKRIPDCNITRWHPEFVDISPNGIDKAQGLLAIAGKEGFAPNETMAFGDGGNDIGIIKQTGIGVAMGNALPEVKQAADHTTTSVDEDGVFKALKQFNVI